jgi:hypothetical protein
VKRWGICCSRILVVALSFDASAKSKTASKAKQKSAKKEKRNTRRAAARHEPPDGQFLFEGGRRSDARVDHAARPVWPVGVTTR